MAGEDDARLRITVRAWAQLASLVAMTSFSAAEAMAAKMTGDPAATCSDLIRPADNAVRIESATIGWADTARHRRKRADAGGARHAGQSGILQGARPDRAVRSQGAADQIPGQPAGRLERPLAAIWRRRLQRRADHGPRRCRRPFRSARLRRWRGASSPMAPILATRPSRASRRSCLRSTTKRSRISRIDPTRGCATPPSP